MFPSQGKSLSLLSLYPNWALILYVLCTQNGQAGADLYAGNDWCSIFHFQIMEFDRPAALLANENSRFRAMLQASEHQSRWRHPESTLIWARTQMQSCTNAQKRISVNAHLNYSSLHPATVLSTSSCYVWQSLIFQTKEAHHILEDRRNLTMQTNFPLLQCRKNDCERAKEGLQDSHDSTLYFM